MSSTYGDFFQNITSILQGSFTSAAAGMTTYILPVGWLMFAMSLLVWSILMLEGKVSSPVQDWILKGIVILLILYAAGNLYPQWVSGPLFELPTDLTNAIGVKGTPATILDALSDQMLGLIDGIAASMANQAASLNIGGAIVLFFALILVSIAGVFVIVAAAYNILYAQIGLTIVLAFGPFFIMSLMWKQTAQYFSSWLNTALYFVFLSVTAAFFVTLFINVVANYMTQLNTVVGQLAPAAAGASTAAKIAGLLDNAIAGPTAAQASGELNVLSIAFQLVFICIPMFFVETQLPTIVASMTGGSGGSFGSGGYFLTQAFKKASGGSK